MPPKLVLDFSLSQQRFDIQQRLLLVEEREAVDLANVAALVDQLNTRRTIEFAFRQQFGPLVVSFQHRFGLLRRLAADSMSTGVEV